VPRVLLSLLPVVRGDCLLISIQLQRKDDIPEHSFLLDYRTVYCSDDSRKVKTPVCSKIRVGVGAIVGLATLPNKSTADRNGLKRLL